jgi:antitoxin MazE
LEEVMEVSVIKIGNSKGIRLSKTLLEKYNIKDTVDLIMEAGQIIIKPLSKPRRNWEQAFKSMAKNEDDKLLMNDVFEDENLEEWK